MDTKKEIKIAAIIGAFKIAIDRAINNNNTPDEFIKMFTSKHGQESFIKLVDAAKKHLELKNN